MAEQRTCEGDFRFCEACYFSDETKVQVSAFCKTCTDFLCNECSNGHRRNTVTRHHEMLVGEDIPKDLSMVRLMKKLTTCTVHPDVPKTIKCNDHGELICMSCLASTHRRCEDIAEICNLSASTQSAREKLFEDIKCLLKRTYAMRISKQNNVVRIRSDRNRVLNKQKCEINKIRKHYDDLLKKSKAEIEDTVDIELKTLYSSVKRCESLVEELKEKQTLFDIARQYGNSTEYKIVMDVLKLDIEQLNIEVNKQRSDNIRLNFEHDEKGDITTCNSLGTVRIVTNNDTIGIVTPVENLTLDDAKSKTDRCENVLKQTGNFERKYSIQHRDDVKSCSINRILILSDGRLVLSDANNKNIKVVNKEYVVMYTYDLDGIPIDMCESAPNHLAVVYHDQSKFARFLVTQKNIVSCGVFSTKSPPLSVAQYETEITAIVILLSNKINNSENVTCAPVTEVEVRNFFSGQIVYTISDFHTLESEQILNPKRIRIALVKPHRIIISEGDTLHCFEDQESEFRHRWLIKNSTKMSLNGITDIVTDSACNSYICCSNYQSIIQVPDANYLAQKVIISEIEHPLSLAINDQCGQIFVCCQDINYLLVYDFK